MSVLTTVFVTVMFLDLSRVSANRLLAPSTVGSSSAVCAF